MKPFLHSALDLLTISCVSTVVRAEPDQDLLGKAQGYPVGNASTGVVARAPAPNALPKAANLAAIFYGYKNNSYTLNDYLVRQRTTAPLVLKTVKSWPGSTDIAVQMMPAFCHFQWLNA